MKFPRIYRDISIKTGFTEKAQQLSFYEVNTVTCTIRITYNLQMLNKQKLFTTTKTQKEEQNMVWYFMFGLVLFLQ